MIRIYSWYLTGFLKVPSRASSEIFRFILKHLELPELAKSPILRRRSLVFRRLVAARALHARGYGLDG